MVLNELGARIGAALAHMSNAATIDEKVLDECLKEISNALVQARCPGCNAGADCKIVSGSCAERGCSGTLRVFRMSFK